MRIRFFGPSPEAAATAWVDAERSLSQADLISVEGSAERVAWFEPANRGPPAVTAW